MRWILVSLSDSLPLLMIMDKKFTIQHYAGTVTYSCGEQSPFVFKNKDNLFLSIVIGMTSTTEPFIAALFKDDAADTKSGPPPTSGADIRQSAQLLIERLSVCFGHYIRCIKPNQTKSALTFESSDVKHQVTYLGILENVRVKKAGYSYRNYFRNFIERFGPLCDSPVSSTGGKDVVNQIIAKVCSFVPITPDTPPISRDEFAIGKSKVFVRSPETIFTMAENLEKKMDPIGYKTKMDEFKRVEKLAARNKRNQDRGSGGKCVLM